MKNRLFVPLLMIAVSGSADAQTPSPAPPAARPALAIAPPDAPPAEASAVRRPRRSVLPATLQLRVVISDQAGSGEPQKKQLELRLAEGERFFLRTEAHSSALRPRLNADARAEVLGERAALQLTIEYAAHEAGADKEAHVRAVSNFKYQWSELVLDLGRPTVVLQTNDPAADRRIAIEVTLSAVKP